MDQFQQLRDSILGATNPGNGAPAPVTGDNPALQKFYDINYQLPLSSAGLGALAAQDTVTVTNQKRAAAEAAAAAKDATDPNKYQQVAKADGGYSYFDGAGKEISASQYAAAKGISTADAVKGSQNPIDIQYQNDFNNLQDFLNAVTTGDSKTTAEYYKQNPQLKKMSPSQVIQNFKQAYPTVFGQGGFQGAGTAGQRLGSTFIPNSSLISQNLRGGSSTSLADLVAQAQQGR